MVASPKISLKESLSFIYRGLMLRDWQGRPVFPGNTLALRNYSMRPFLRGYDP